MSRLPPAPIVARQRPGDAGVLARPGVGERTVSASSSGSSSGSSHSSYIEREREEHLGEAPDQKPSVAKPVAAAVAILLYIFACQAMGLWLFTSGFLLTRTTLEDRSSCLADEPATAWRPPRSPAKIDMANQESLLAWQDSLSSAMDCTLPAKYGQTVLWIIDALRYDFIAEMPETNTTGWTPNPHYHGVLRLPSELDRKESRSFSFLSHFVADAPTTTLQRLKGLSTGSLPTFIDAGSNFGGSAITEDTWLSQLRNRSKDEETAGLGFVGDDTWSTVFPSIFDKAWTWPLDSFNVEDLDSVDRGVKTRLGEVIQDSGSKSWRLLVGHMLGVDHVGHRLGASHPRMRVKLQEMNDYAEKLLAQLPEDALLVLMGDHGMDENGDHGGEGELEVGAGLWMFSKRQRKGRGIDKAALGEITRASSHLIPPYRTFSPLPAPPFDEAGHRSIPQIDFVPTISLLMGLPIPFNNLGSVIPEAFESMDDLLRALRINAFQIHRYLAKYSQSSKDLEQFRTEIDAAWHQALRQDADFARHLHAPGSSKTQEKALREACSAYISFNRLSLIRAKSIWAKFEMTKMAVGLGVLLLSILTCVTTKAIIDQEGNDVVFAFNLIYGRSRKGVMAGSLSLLLLKLLSRYLLKALPLQSIGLIEAAGLGAVLGAQICTLPRNDFKMPSRSKSTTIGLVLPIVHSIAFSSNSFILYEDRLLLALAATAFAWRGMQGYLSAPTTRLKIRIPAFATLAILSLRLASIFKVCREEQGPECRATFYSASGNASNSLWTIAMAYACALVVPSLMARALSMSKSHAGVAPLFINWMLRPALLLGAGYWLVDWALVAESLSIEEDTTAYLALKWAKLALARADMALIAVVGLSFWVFSPLCLEMKREDIAAPPNAAAAGQQQQQQQPSQRVIVLGFANSFGSTYLLLLSLLFALLFLVAQPSGQISLSLVFIALYCCAELGDAERDVILLSQDKPSPEQQQQQPPPTTSLPTNFLEISSIALIAYLAFFHTGHQATFPSIQWRTAFIGFDSVNYPFSPLLVILNSFGPMTLLPAMSVPLLSLWNLAPKPRAAPNSPQVTERMPTIRYILQASLSYVIYHLITTFASALFATHFRRHLMLFKVWTPRFLLSAVGLQLTLLGLVLGLVATGNVSSKVSLTFGSRL